MDEIEFYRRVQEARNRKALQAAYMRAMRQVFGPPWLYIPICGVFLCMIVVLGINLASRL